MLNEFRIREYILFSGFSSGIESVDYLSSGNFQMLSVFNKTTSKWEKLVVMLLSIL